MLSELNEATSGLKTEMENSDNLIKEQADKEAEEAERRKREEEEKTEGSKSTRNFG